jgi:hypothetical protein
MKDAVACAVDVDQVGCANDLAAEAECGGVGAAGPGAAGADGGVPGDLLRS